jgi:2,5-dioxopentanoate dehydrogenase
MEQNIEQIIAQAALAFQVYKQISKAQRADFLERIATNIEAIGEKLPETAAQESNLPLARFIGERGRTCGQLRMFAQHIREGSWVEATIDTALANRLPAPKPDIRRMLVPIGPVAVFGASNFPLAFSTAGGDTASALASGCTVVYKEHPAHPKTSAMVAEAIAQAIKECKLPESTFCHVSGGIEEGQALVRHPKIKAIAFTGSFQGGKALFDLANQRPEPITVYAEMGSVNPIFILPTKFEGEQKAIARQLAASITLGVGQFCTNPGLLFIPEQVANNFLSLLSDAFAAISPAPMLHSGIANAYQSGVNKHAKQKGVDLHFTASTQENANGFPALASVSLKDWMENPRLQEEVFGPFSLVVIYPSTDTLTEAANQLHGQLTCTLWASENQLLQHSDLIFALQEKCGRLLFDGVPTGVEVCHSMTHGGPFPATTNSQSTSVGTYAIKRFARPFSYQSCPESLLPSELKDENSLEIWRTINGILSKSNV